VVPNSTALRQGSHIKVETLVSRLQRVGDLIGSGFEPYTSRTKSRLLATIWLVRIFFSACEYHLLSFFGTLSCW